MTERPMRSKRDLCAHCGRPPATCVCGLVTQVNNRVALIILQHPQETKETKNTAQLLNLCLNNSQLFVGEGFDDAFFAQQQLPDVQDLLLYPDTPEEKSMGLAAPVPLDLAAYAAAGKALRLWVLDATWRKSRKMLYLNPLLQTMPRLSLRDCPPSLYTIRKAHNENQLSTLEASCYALRQLEQNTVDYSPVLSAFAAFVAQQQSFQPDRPTPLSDPL